MTTEQRLEHIEQMLEKLTAAFFAQVTPPAEKFDDDLNLLATEGPEALQKRCRERMQSLRLAA